MYLNVCLRLYEYMFTVQGDVKHILHSIFILSFEPYTDTGNIIKL